MTRFRFGKGPSDPVHNPQQRDYDKINLGRPTIQQDYGQHNNQRRQQPTQRDYDQVNFSRSNHSQFNEPDYDNEDFYDPQAQQGFNARHNQQQDPYYQQRVQHEQSFGAPPAPQYFGNSQGGSARPYTRQMMPTQRQQEFRDWEENDDYYESSRDPEQWSDRPSPMRFIIAISGLVMIAAVSWFAYRWASSTSGEPPIISPEQGPFKVRPEHPGGMVIPHQDKLIYDRISANSPQTVERLLPPPDQAVASSQHQHQVPQQQMAQNEGGYENYQQGVAPVPNRQINPVAEGQAPQQQLPKIEQVIPPQNTAQGSYPQGMPVQNTLRTVHNKQQSAPASPQMENTRSQPQAIQADSAQQPNEQKIITAPPPPTPTTAEIKKPEAVNQNQQDELKKILSDTVEQIKPKETVTSAPEANLKPLQGYFAQLATLPNEHSAQKEWKRLKDRYGKELKGITWHIRPYNMTSGKKYRILIGSFKSKATTKAKCQQLGIACSVIQLP